MEIVKTKEIDKLAKYILANYGFSKISEIDNFIYDLKSEMENVMEDEIYSDDENWVDVIDETINRVNNFKNHYYIKKEASEIYKILIESYYMNSRKKIYEDVVRLEDTVIEEWYYFLLHIE